MVRADTETGAILTVEDHWAEGGPGEAVLAALAESDGQAHIVCLAVREMPASATPEEQLADADLDASPIGREARRLVAGQPERRQASAARS